QAFSRPGQLQRLEVALDSFGNWDPGTVALLLTLCDFETNVLLEPDDGEFASYLKLHTGAQIVSDRSAADFVAVTEPEPEYGFEHLRIGTDETPHLSATLLLQVKSFQNGTPVRLSGPGIKGSTTLLVKGLSSGFFERRSSFRFPRGVDIFFIANQQLVGLPRTTIAEVKY
ncbi:MAG TPA: phosphonate C-P lyase system protein PhnH, partial [Chthoniobacterales bacterium]|nr:phosphonate C-P lyase system protein PhnH [Chthoniobacterales bacterium]